MKIKEIEETLIDYCKSNEIINHKENALKEFDKVHTKFPLDDLIHIGFIINDYPSFDHFLLKISDDNFFLKIGLNKEYLKKLDKKDIHKVAKALHSFLGTFKLKKEKQL